MRKKTVTKLERSGQSRSALWRVMEVHKLVQAGRHPNCQTLAREIEVTAKTIQRDIGFMRDQLGMPLKYDPVRRGYFYTRAVTDFPMLALSRNDLVALFLARHALEPMRGTRLERMLRESFRKIAGACAGEISIEWHELDEAFSVKAAGVVAADVTLFGDLMEAVRGCREVVFEYRKLTGREPERRRVHPYHVGQIEHGWYVVAYDPEREGMRTFALQRMAGLEVTRSRFKKAAGFNAEDYLGRGFGVWSYANEGGELHQVRLRFEGYAARVVGERRWHASQVVERVEADGSVIEFQVTLAGLEEITRWVLSWGRMATVLGPPELKQRVREELAGMLRNEEG